MEVSSWKVIYEWGENIQFLLEWQGQTVVHLRAMLIKWTINMSMIPVQTTIHIAIYDTIWQWICYMSNTWWLIPWMMWYTLDCLAYVCTHYVSMFPAWQILNASRKTFFPAGFVYSCNWNNNNNPLNYSTSFKMMNIYVCLQRSSSGQFSQRSCINNSVYRGTSQTWYQTSRTQSK